MTSPTPDHWQIQDAKQRFSEMIRAVTSDGPQVITRHGEDVAVVVDIDEYRRLTRPMVDLAGILLGGPKVDDAAADVFAEIEAERKADFGRPVDLEAGMWPTCSAPTCCPRRASVRQLRAEPPGARARPRTGSLSPVLARAGAGQ